MPEKPLAAEDLRHIVLHAKDVFILLRDARIFVTGGTGFFGRWLLESLLYANRQLDLKVRVTLLTRSPALFRERAPHIANSPVVRLLEGDVTSFQFPTDTHSHVLHAATESGGGQKTRPAYELADSIVDGARHVLNFARGAGVERLLFTSTGAVYGRSTSILATPETYAGAPDPLLLQSSYDEAKRMAEHLCIAYAQGTRVQPVIARCFAFVGPHLPLDQHFAIGNFMQAALSGTPLHIRGDGTPRRSWLYMTDLAIWLWTILVHGKPGRAYNVGSDEGMTISEAAKLTVATLCPNIPIQIDGTPTFMAPINSYVPDITRARDELGLQVTVSLAEALRRTASWHRYNNV